MKMREQVRMSRDFANTCLCLPSYISLALNLNPPKADEETLKRCVTTHQSCGVTSQHHRKNNITKQERKKGKDEVTMNKLRNQTLGLMNGFI